MSSQQQAGPTAKQTDYILHLANRVTQSNCRYLDQHRKYIRSLCGINVTNMSKYEASTVIDSLFDALDEAEHRGDLD